MTTENKILTLKDVCTPKVLAEENASLFTEKQVHWMIKIRNRNGLAASGAILKVSNKVYINKAKFAEWFLSQEQTA